MSCSCCKYQSCDIYADHHRHENEWFEEYVYGFHEKHYNGGYGVEPLFDPFEVHAKGNEALVKKLEQNGIGVDNCQFLHPRKGCMLGDLKPAYCKIDFTICESVYKSIETPYFKMTSRMKNKVADYVTYEYHKGNISFTIIFELVVSKEKERGLQFSVNSSSNHYVDMRNIVYDLYQLLQNAIEEAPYFKLRSQINKDKSLQIGETWFHNQMKSDELVKQIITHILSAGFVKTHVFDFDDRSEYENIVNAYIKAKDQLRKTHSIDIELDRNGSDVQIKTK